MVNLGHLQVGNFANWEDVGAGPLLRLLKSHGGRAVWVDLNKQEVRLLSNFLRTYLSGVELLDAEAAAHDDVENEFAALDAADAE